MSKRLLFIVSVMILCVSLIACSAPAAEVAQTMENSPDVQTEDVVEEIPQDSDVEPFTLENDVGVTINGTWYPVLTDAAPMVESMGEHELFESPSCVYDSGDDKEFSCNDYSIFTNPVEGKDIWYDFMVKGGSIQTARGIKIGDSVDDVIAAYGDNYYWEGENVLTYSVSGIEGDYESPCIIFTLHDDKVSLFNIYYPTNTV